MYYKNIIYYHNNNIYIFFFFTETVLFSRKSKWTINQMYLIINTQIRTEFKWHNISIVRFVPTFNHTLKCVLPCPYTGKTQSRARSTPVSFSPETFPERTPYWRKRRCPPACRQREIHSSSQSESHWATWFHKSKISFTCLNTRTIRAPPSWGVVCPCLAWHQIPLYYWSDIRQKYKITFIKTSKCSFNGNYKKTT